jgi:ComF family protein
MEMPDYLHNFVGLFFPDYCAGCGKLLLKQEQSICLYCILKLPRTHMHDEIDNYVERLFWGRTNVVSATAFLRMPRHGVVHRLIHELKYRDNEQVGEYLGNLFAQDLSTSERMSDFDVVIPVPLHPAKERWRGYNQSYSIAKGLAQGLNVTAEADVLLRHSHTESQTRKSRYSRWQNVHGLFGVTQNNKLEHRHVLLVDDVITTGATLEACANALLAVKGVRVSIAALALPVR